MKPESGRLKKSTLKVQLFIFLFLASLYIITTAGYPTTSMGVSAVFTAISLIEEGDFALDEPTLETGVGKDGKYYCYEGLAFILIVSFFYAFSILIGLGTNGFIFTNQIITPIACVILFLLGKELKYSTKTSIILTLTYGIGTMAWVHSRFLMPEPLTTVLYLTAFLFLLRFKNTKNEKWSFLCGCFTGLSLLVRPDAPLFALSIGAGVFMVLYSFYRQKNKDLWCTVRAVILFVVPLILFSCVNAFYNYTRFGDFLEFGYSTKVQEVTGSDEGLRGYSLFGISMMLQGFAGMWIIPCRSIFFINPVLIFIFWAVKDFWKKFKFEFVIIGTMLLLHVLFYTNRGPTAFAGSSAWGVRYMVPWVSFMVIVIGIFVDRIMRDRKRKPVLKYFILVLILSSTFQFIGSSQNYQDTQLRLEKEYNDKWTARRMMNMNPKWNLIIQNLKLLRSGQTDFMYYSFLTRDDFIWKKLSWSDKAPPWVGVSLFVLVLTLSSSGYLLFKQFLALDEERKKKKGRS